MRTCVRRFKDELFPVARPVSLSGEHGLTRRNKTVDLCGLLPVARKVGELGASLNTNDRKSGLTGASGPVTG